MKLYSVVLLAVMVAVVCAERGKGKGKGNGWPTGKMVKTCMDEVGADKDDKKSMKSEQPTAKGLCAIDCIVKKMKVINADGSFNQEEADKITAKMPEKMQEGVKKHFEECKALATAGGKDCESGGKFGHCMMKKMKPHKGKGGKKGKDSSEEDND